jgi:hypothetical protein
MITACQDSSRCFDGVDQGLDVLLDRDAADVDHDLVLGSQAERRLQLVAIDQRVDSAGIAAVGDDHHVVADMLGEVPPHRFVDADDRRAEQFVGSRRGRHQRALPRLVHEDAVLHVDRRARQVRDSLDEVE